MSNIITTVHDIYLSLQLYSPVRFDASNPDQKKLIEDFIIGRTASLDFFNIELKENSTYKISNINYIDYTIFNGDIYSYSNCKVYREKKLSCVRNEHSIVFYFRIDHIQGDFFELTKVGQFPSMADLEIEKNKKYTKLLSKEYLHELNKAIGLASHGVGIGSFVYIRRIFEHLIEKYHEYAKKQNNWNEDIYAKGQMGEKIELLTNYLPEIVVEFSSLYSILSKGIHELTEEECLEYFPIIKDAIIAMLEKDYLKSEYERSQQELRTNMNRIRNNLSNK